MEAVGLHFRNGQAPISDEASDSLAKQVLVVPPVHDLLIKGLHYYLEHEGDGAKVADLGRVVITRCSIDLLE